jgi:hypothetical protein
LINSLGTCIDSCRATCHILSHHLREGTALACTSSSKFKDSFRFRLIFFGFF